ncbi:hypothetical protein D2E34_16565 [Mycobacteroides abscessus]|nr:hypothetical protein D2E34_16565 [Mycobacteroides abscessus]
MQCFLIAPTQIGELARGGMYVGLGSRGVGGGVAVGLGGRHGSRCYRAPSGRTRMGLREFSEIFTKRCPPIAVDRRRWTNSLHWMPTRCSRSCPISTVLTSRMPRPRCVRRQS